MNMTVTNSAIGTQPPFSMHHPSERTKTRPTIHFFLDFSNIAISAGKISHAHGDGVFCSSKVRLHCGNLRQFVERDRIWGSGFAAAGLMNQNSPIKQHFKNIGIEFQICERGCVTGREQNVDERIQNEMLGLLDPEIERGTIVLATGDGSGFHDGRGFIKTLKIMRSFGFEIEVMSWQHSFNPFLRDWAKENGRAIELDCFYEDLTFIDGARAATPTNRLNSKLARHKNF